MANDLVLRLKGDNKDLKKAFAESQKQVQELTRKCDKLSVELNRTNSAQSKFFNAFNSGAKSGNLNAGSLLTSLTKIGGTAGVILGVSAGITELGKGIMSATQFMDGFNNMAFAVKNTVFELGAALLTADWKMFTSGILAANKELEEMKDTLGDVERSYATVMRQAQSSVKEAITASRDDELSISAKKTALARGNESLAELKQHASARTQQLRKTLSGYLKANGGNNYNDDQIDYIVKNYAKLDNINAERQLYEARLANWNNQSGGVSKYRRGARPAPLNYSESTLEMAKVVSRLGDKERMALDNLKANIEQTSQDISELSKSLNRANKTINNELSTAARSSTSGQLAPGATAIAAGKIAPLTVPGMAAGTLAQPELSFKSGEIDALVNSKALEQLTERNQAIMESIGAYEGLANSIYGVADALGAADSGFGIVMKTLSAFLGGIPQAISSINALSKANQSEAVSSAGAAVGETAKQNAKLGPLGWISAIAGIAALIASISQIVKFADGGIVPGKSWSGDKVLSRLNSGEMVLNRGQQSRLFGMINSGASAGSTSVQVAKIVGSDLELVINNHNRKFRT